jgi:hypothetical protein
MRNSLAVCFCLLALGLNTVHADFDSSGSAASPAQIQANRPWIVPARDVLNADLLKLILNGAPVELVDANADSVTITVLKLIAAPQPRVMKPKPAPGKKPVPKPRRTVVPSQ